MIVKPDRTTPPPIHDIGPLRLEPEIRIKLDNGVTLHTLSGGNAGVSRVKVILPGGAAESPVPRLYALAGNLIPEGSMTHPGSSLPDIFENSGSWTGTENSTHHSGISLYCLNSSYGMLLPLMREMVLQPEFAPGIVGHTLQAEASRIGVEQQKVLYRAECALKEMVYGPGHPLTPVPSPSQLLSITPSQLHEAHARRLDPRGTHIYISGRLTRSMIDEAAEVWSRMPAGPSFPTPRLIFPEHNVGGRTHVDMHESMQSGVRMTIPVIGRNHPDFVPLRMAVIALGGYFGSRLMLNIREDRGLTYGISSSLIGYRHSGFLSISSQTDPSTVEELISETVNEIERMKDPASYTSDEINRLSRFVLSELAGVLENPFTRMDFLQTEITANTPPDYYARQKTVARSLSPELLSQMASRYFDTSRLFIATAGR